MSPMFPALRPWHADCPPSTVCSLPSIALILMTLTLHGQYNALQDAVVDDLGTSQLLSPRHLSDHFA